MISIWAELAPSYPDWTLKIYGDGEDRAKLEALVSGLNLSDSVSLMKPTSDMRSVYKESSIYAMTSRYEGLPMVLIEAQTMGLPIVSYACKCGPRDIITSGEDGFLLEEGDAVGFAHALKRLMDDVDLRQRMGVNSRQHSAVYDLSLLMQQWESLFS